MGDVPPKIPWERKHISSRAWPPCRRLSTLEKDGFGCRVEQNSNVSNRDGLGPVENRKHVTVVLAGRSAHIPHTLASGQHQPVWGRNTAGH